MNHAAFLRGYLHKEAYVTRDVSVQEDSSEDLKTSETSHGQEETDDLEKKPIGDPDDSVHSKEASGVWGRNILSKAKNIGKADDTYHRLALKRDKLMDAGKGPLSEADRQAWTKANADRNILIADLKEYLRGLDRS